MKKPKLSHYYYRAVVILGYEIGIKVGESPYYSRVIDLFGKRRRALLNSIARIATLTHRANPDKVVTVELQRRRPEECEWERVVTVEWQPAKVL